MAARSGKEMRRNNILEAARQCLARFGFDKMTLDDVGKIVGLNKASLYYYYSSKEALIIDVLTTEAVEYIESLREKVESVSSSAGIAKAVVGGNVSTGVGFDVALTLLLFLGGLKSSSSEEEDALSQHRTPNNPCSAARCPSRNLRPALCQAGRGDELSRPAKRDWGSRGHEPAGGPLRPHRRR